MKIKIQQFLGTNHSWAEVGHNLARSFIKLNHEVHLKSTNGYEHFPKDLEPFVHENLEKVYDMQISYTAMTNFQHYLSNGRKNRFGIWNYDGTVLPEGFAKHHKFCDKLLPSSAYSARPFIDANIPKEKIVVIPHGINLDEFSTNEVYQLKTKKKVKVLSNVAQLHLRKNIPAMFEVFGKAFTKQDDVCLVCKIPKIKKGDKKPFDIDFWKVYNEFCKRYPNHAKVEIISEFLPSMTPLYNAVDINFSMTRLEGWFLPGTESLATNTLNVVSRYGGHLDFLNDDNAILIDGKPVRCPKDAQYWTPSVFSEWFNPSIDDAVDKLRYAVNNIEILIEDRKELFQNQVKSMTWDNVANQILGLVEK